jgi:hypothetical protein
MNVIIWSKNRACQLDLLLRSIKRYWKDYDRNEFRVIYDYDNAGFKKGYDIVMEAHPWVKYIGEINFRADLIHRALTDSAYIGFFCDDDVFTNDFEWNTGLLANPDIACISLRLGTNIVNHYIKGPCEVPERKGGVWSWKGKQIDWGYPMSAGSGHIFRMSDIKPILTKSKYENPTELEDAMNAHKIDRSKMFCYDKSVVFNLAVNRVQTVRKTKCGELSARELNNKFLNGDRIDLEPYHNYENKSAHEIKDLKWSR